MLLTYGIVFKLGTAYPMQGVAFGEINFEAIKEYIRTNPYVNFIPFRTISLQMHGGPVGAHYQMVLNIMAFVPFGILLPLSFDRFKNIIRFSLAALLLTLAFELSQMLFLIGIFDIDDIMLNMLGAWIGYAIIFFFKFLFRKELKDDTF